MATSRSPFATRVEIVTMRSTPARFGARKNLVEFGAKIGEVEMAVAVDDPHRDASAST